MKTSSVRKQRLHELDRLLGIHLAELRLAHGLTQEEVADRMDFKRALISKIESGQRSLMAVEVIDYARALNIAPDDLLGHLAQIHVEYSGDTLPDNPTTPESGS